MIYVFKHRKGQTYEQVKLAKKKGIFLFTCLTFLAPVVTNINFLLTTSIRCQEKWLGELIK